MSAPARRKLTPEEKAANEAKYRLKKATDITPVLNNVVNQVVALQKVSAALYALPKGSVLQFTVPENGQVVELKRSAIRPWLAKVVSKIRDLKNYYRFARKREKRVLEPSSFKGIYVPVYFGSDLNGGEQNPLRIFFNTPGELGPVDPRQGAASGELISRLPYVSSGYALRASVNALFFIAKNNRGMQRDASNAQLITPDEAMMVAFGQVPALLIPDGQGNLVPNTTGASTFQILQSRAAEPDKKRQGEMARLGITDMYDQRVTIGNVKQFNPSSFPMFYLQSLTSLNVWTAGLLAGQGDLSARLQDAGTRQQLLQEYATIKNALDSWNALREPEKQERAKRKNAQKREQNAQKRQQKQQQAALAAQGGVALPNFTSPVPGPYTQGLAVPGAQ